MIDGQTILKMKKKAAINTDQEYIESMNTIFILLDKKGSNLTDAETKHVSEIAVACEKYEDEELKLKPGQ